ncbi:CHC2 zinc finger domain-containing protein [Cytobacillus sp. FJAT-54145]|uniref:CHC2 zinc finger domain-containing protein n=1 Tax=Cytobacillus spartinae TaxID=3299023 RepID=A0ABW6KA03_9BACI
MCLTQSGTSSPSNIALLKERMNILDLATSLTLLRKSGRAYKGCCPFHSEKSPSFYVWPHKGTFKCFGCGVYGSAIDLYAKRNELTFPEAVRALEEEFGLESKPILKSTYPRLKRQDFRDLGLRPNDMMTLFDEDPESYFFLLKGKLRERIMVWQNLMATSPEGPIRESSKKSYDRFYSLWLEGYVKEREVYFQKVGVAS